MKGMIGISRCAVLMYCFIFLTFCSFAQSRNRIPVEPLKFQLLTIDDGLSQGMVTSITQDKNGFMWFGTKDGLNKYDGYRFTIYRQEQNDSLSLADNYIFSVHADSRGLLWIVFAGGQIDIFNPETETAYHLSAELPIVNLNSVSGFRFLDKSDGTIFLSTIDRFLQVHLTPLSGAPCFGYTVKVLDLSGKVPVFNRSGTHVAKFISSAGKLHFSTYDSVFVYAGADLSQDVALTRYPASAFCQTNVPVFEHVIDPAELTGFSAEDTVRQRTLSVFRNSFTLIDLKTGRKTDSASIDNYYFAGSPSGIYFRNALFDDKGRIWLLSQRTIFLYDPSTRQIKEVVAQNPTINKRVFIYATSIYKDLSGVIWIGTSGFGLIKYDCGKERFHHIAGKGEENFSIQGIWESIDQSGLWIRSLDTEIVLYNKEASRISGNAAFSDHLVKSVNSGLYASDKKLYGEGFSAGSNGYWILKTPYFCFLDKDLNIRRKLGAVNGPPLLGGVSVRDWKGNTWMATGIGEHFVLYLLNEDSSDIVKKYFFPIQKSSFSYRFTSAMVVDKNGDLWLGTLEGLFRFNPSTETWTHYAHNPRNALSLPVNSVFSLCNDAYDGTILWIGTDGGGLVRFDKRTGRCTVYNSKSGLPNDVVYGVLADNKGDIWMSTNKGIALLHPATSEVKTYTVIDGLQSNEFNRYASCKLQSGKLVFGGVNGFNIFDPDEIRDKAFQPNVLLTGFKIGNKEVVLHPESDLLSKNIYATQELQLNYKQNYITFQYAVTDYASTEKIVYQYQMEGLDKDWLPSNALNEATYTNLSPGYYTFRVRGTNSDGVWSKHEAAIQIFIAPPWWGTWWFQLAIVLMVAISAYSLYRYRLRNILMLHKLRNRIATDLHDEIGSTLSSITLYSEAAKKMVADNESASKVLTRINANTSEMLEAMSDIVWAINTRNDKLDNLVNRMRNFAVQLSEAKNFNLHLAENEDLPDMPLDMYQRKNLYLIFKEALNNAAKYAQCRNLWIRFVKTGNILEMNIKDDGVGFYTKNDAGRGVSAGGGNGLLNMKKRASDLNAELKIISEPDKGTEIICRMKLS